MTDNQHPIPRKVRRLLDTAAAWTGWAVIIIGTPAATIAIAAFIGVFLLTNTPSRAADLTGRASVIDGDTIEIHGQRVRLWGIDAPESAQTCNDLAGKPYRCGQKAALALADKIGAATITCEQKDIDRYQRIVAVCSLGELDLNGWLVNEGLAIEYVRYSDGRYVDEQAAAREARRGLWAGTFQEPAAWRQADKRKLPATDTSECRIKGNISAKGERIYHVPGGGYYDATKIDAAKGERWFCTEAEAKAAGWRRSKR